MTTAFPKPSWALKKQVLVSLPQGDNPCLAKLYIDYDGEANQGTISLNFKTNLLANPKGKLEQFSLNIPPSAVERYKVVQPTTETLFPESFLAELPAQTHCISTVVTLTLQLHEMGTVAGPPLIQLPDQEDSNLAAFEMICKSSLLYIHFTQRQFNNGELDRLKTFFFTLKEGLRPKVFNHARKGRIERDGHVFGKMLDPPPYSEESEPEQTKKGEDLPSYKSHLKGVHVGGKRRRDHSSIPPEDDRRTRHVLTSPEPSCYSTEPNTPSIPSPVSASIQPTHFTRASSLDRIEHDTLARIENLLQGASDNLIRHLLTRLGCRCQRPTPAPVESWNLSSKPETERIDPNVQAYIDRAIAAHFQSDNIQTVFENMVSKGVDQVFDACKMHETEFREQVEECNIEVRMTANECVKEIQEQAQQCLDEIDEQVQQCKDDLKVQGEEVEMSAEEAEIARLRRWFDIVSAQARPFGSCKSSLQARHELSTAASNVRRSSF
ncbi:uncharacterized protein BO95DRAFT_447917 [Aspergillus brunneoviolaceus CBS 621.78]|uniref:Uncharacterized protein n=1 Tax=Aspergillus brunneoviolaceus CBS 621.78 TaxID=1450534 RepID=A0ACD1FTP6_9EURO|nr:hypothetical protein BO95DRAFT_447917 [Aspergillus brunneoviolaceus CBS 621.78]RAH40378.1 hypothetical protein BO95DRAFT_447917 [Aspergillus brunneoviolaceus CBS 621.78]